MSKTKNTTGKVPETKVDEPKVIKGTKSQRELFFKQRDEINKIIGDLNNYLSGNVLGKSVENFMEELGIDVVNEDWEFDSRTVQFTRREKKDK